ncbi:aldo/keto reductase [Enterococcus rotai]|uniref:aldo/keto reductase n=1 Tax=Enterococcus rotai TaxID=118060 RepID=UPI001FC971E5|nr:aldo/keto reductase [Enterococcus rotai]
MTDPKDAEKAVGRGLGAFGVPREALFVTTKIWVENGSDDGLKTSFQRSLDRLGLGYVCRGPN